MEFLRFCRFYGFDGFWFSMFWFSRFWFSALHPSAPFRFAAKTVDTELAEEFEMVAELIGGHG